MSKKYAAHDRGQGMLPWTSTLLFLAFFPAVFLLNGPPAFGNQGQEPAAQTAVVQATPAATPAPAVQVIAVSNPEKASTPVSAPLAAKVTTVKETQPVEATPIAEIPEKWGIEILSLRLTAGNNMLDFRYRVLDPQKAAPLFEKETQAYLLDEATNKKLLVPNPPKVGPLRTTRQPKAHKNYFIIFGNPGEHLKKDSLATVVLGKLKVEHLSVE